MVPQLTLLAKGRPYGNREHSQSKNNLIAVDRASGSRREILLARGEQHVAKLVPLQPKGCTRKFGALKGTVRVSREFFDPLPEQEFGSLE